MTKYSNDFKVKIISEYLVGAGSTFLHHKYHIPGHDTVLKWMHQYQSNGSVGFKNREKRSEYASNFKLEVLKWMKENHSSLNETANHFNISTSSTIYQWDRRFQARGLDGLRTKRGRPPMGKRKKSDPTNQVKRNKKVEEPFESDQQRLKDLEKENKLLRIENEYLKKLEALVRQREQHERNKRK
ncbi:helix-turn-helix domain-containing protein [Sporolactobacillus pectinivorans]|uniref:helix-turn-helix domain-containing protein n=1 Tax=Sporolactobacillus pectinivorans TaxID=1591408 RepID=UPI000C25950D|nr:helix-turn-helix domain-containing protein [Sporolactobacillus pectinivorans]